MQKYIVTVGDMNINTLEQSSGLDKLNGLCDTLGFHNLSTCEMKGSSTSIDLILTNHNHHFKPTHAFEPGLSDFHKVVITCFQSIYERLQPVKIQYTRPVMMGGGGRGPCPPLFEVQNFLMKLKF